MMTSIDQDIEIDLLLEGIYRHYGYDFRSYARASLRRRLLNRLKIEDLENISQMIPKVLHEREFFEHFLEDLSISVTEMFRDPEFFRTLRQEVIPILKTYPFIKVWVAGCATGEEAFSVAIILKEEGLYDRSQIYATDYNKHSLEFAKKGVYSLELIEKYQESYIESGGNQNFENYYLAGSSHATLKPDLLERVTFGHHNLVCDQVFSEMHLILCRNVLIYFNKHLQNSVLDLFLSSLCYKGILCLGSKESLRFSKVFENFEPISEKQRIYQENGLNHLTRGDLAV